METSRSILVTNLPELDKKKLRDKLEIHFGKRGNGGGDVIQIVITEQCSLMGTFALITFAEQETVASVLGKQHIFFDKTLTVEPHSSTEEEQRNTDHNTRPKIGFARLPQLPSHDLKLIIHGRYTEDVLQSTAELTNAALQVDEKSTKFCLAGPPVAIVQAVNILGKHSNTKLTTQPHGSGNVGQRKNMTNWTTSLEGHEHRTKETFADKKELSVHVNHSDADPLKVDQNNLGSPEKDVPNPRQKINKHAANTNKPSRNIATFDPKILSYIHAIQHRVITEAGDRFHVDFEAKANGEVEFKSREKNTDQQEINESMKFLKGVVDSIKKMGFVTEVICLMEFEEAPKQKVDEAVKQTLESTDVLVTLKTGDMLEFYGTKQSVHHEIEKLRAGILRRDLQTDSQGDIEQPVYNQTNNDGTQQPSEETGNMDMAGNFRANENFSNDPERLASLDAEVTDEASTAHGVQVEKSVDAPARKPLIHPVAIHEGSSVVGDVQVRFAESLVNGENYLPPEAPPTWKEESNPSLGSKTYNDICYPPNEAKEENHTSMQSWHPVQLTTNFTDESLPNEQIKSSGIVTEQELETAKPKTTYVYMNPGAKSPPVQHNHLQGATQQEEDDEIASLSQQSDDSTKMVEKSMDQVDGIGPLFMTNKIMGKLLDMEPTSRCVPYQESSRDTDEPMEVDPILPVKTSAAVPSPWDSLLYSQPPVDHSKVAAASVRIPKDARIQSSVDHSQVVASCRIPMGVCIPSPVDRDHSQVVASPGRISMDAHILSPVDHSQVVASPRIPMSVSIPSAVDHSKVASPVGTSHVDRDFSAFFASSFSLPMGGIPGRHDTVTQSEDFTVTIRPGMNVVIRQGDITDEFTDVIVTSADPHLQLQNGVGRAVREAAGQDLVRACRLWIKKNGPVDNGQNVWTVGGNLKCSHVLHVVLEESQNGTELKSVIAGLLRTCAQSLQASHVSMPAIGLERMSVSKKRWARAFFDAVGEIAQLYDKGWIQLSTLVLVDRNKALLSEVKRVFNYPNLSGSSQESFQNGRQAVPHPGMSSSRYFTSSGAANYPGFRAKGPSKVRKGASRRGISTTEELDRWSSNVTSTRKASSGEKSAFMDDLPVDDDHKCAICLGRINQEKKLRCKHSFCRKCVDAALKVHKYCPICKQPVQ